MTRSSIRIQTLVCSNRSRKCFLQFSGNALIRKDAPYQSHLGITVLFCQIQPIDNQEFEPLKNRTKSDPLPAVKQIQDSPQARARRARGRSRLDILTAAVNPLLQKRQIRRDIRWSSRTPASA
jgi:hypothetical protein